MDVLYSIKNLHQYYIDKFGKKRTILKVEDLYILQNKFTVILGNSGSGKTTLLEILGSINEIDEGSVIFKPGSEDLSLNNLWKDANAHSLFLRKKLSFTFQDANLLSHFNVEENIAIPNVIENDVLLEKAIEEVENKKILDDFGIADIKDKKIETISGGEHQRVALARSSNSYFDVFLTDEPTGNVGLKHEEIIFQYLRKLVTEEHKSVIVVTHNIQKALEYADQLIIITQKGNSGVITKDNILNLDNKLNSCLLTLNGHLLNIPIFNPIQNAMTVYNPSLLNIIKNRMGGMNEDIAIKVKINKTNSDFIIPFEKTSFKPKICKLCRSLNKLFLLITKSIEKQVNFISFKFIIPLLKMLFTSKNYNFVNNFIKRDIKTFFSGKVVSFIIIFILSLFAISSYTAWNKILKKKLNNPFVNVLLVKNNSEKSMDEISDILLSPDFSKKYYIKMITPTQSVSLKFINKQNENKYSYFSGRTISKKDPLLAKLLDYIEDKNNSPNNYEGLFVTKSFLYKSGYSINDHFIKVTIANKRLYLPIIGVYKFLPGDTYLLTNKYYQMINSGAFFYQKADFISFVDVNNLDFKNKFYFYLTKNKINVSSTINIPHGITFKFYKKYRTSYLDSLWNNFKISSHYSNIKHYYPPNENFIPEKTETTHFDWFFLHRYKIRHSEELKQELSKQNLQIDIEKISTQKDFRTISSLLKIAMLFMEIITFISTLIFIKYSFYIHIFQLRKELGIIKSLGLNDLTLSNIFKLENSIFYFSVMTLGFLYLLILQTINFLLVKLGFIKYYILSILSFNTLFHIIFLYIISILALKYTLDKIVKLTAGNLIYDRIEK